MKVTVAPNKGAVLVLDWGHSPFAVVQASNTRNRAIIPTGFKVEVRSDKRFWIGETCVEDMIPKFRFHLKDSEIKTEWFDNPTSAYRQAFQIYVSRSKHLNGTNGRLIIGVTYDNLQDHIWRIFKNELASLGIYEKPCGKSQAVIAEQIVKNPAINLNTEFQLDSELNKVDTVSANKRMRCVGIYQAENNQNQVDEDIIELFSDSEDTFTCSEASPELEPLQLPNESLDFLLQGFSLDLDTL